MEERLGSSRLKRATLYVVGRCGSVDAAGLHVEQANLVGADFSA